MNVKLSEEQLRMFNLLEKSNDHIFVTGKAGTGKSVLLQYFKENSNKKILVVAPTGVAALNVGGQTIHSLFRIAPGFVNEDNIDVLYRNAGEVLRKADTIVIDEISMVRADLMDAIDLRLQQANNTFKPFGGKQIIMFGDLFQLSPIVNDEQLHKYFITNHGGYFFFHAKVWKKLPKIYELEKVFRQKDQDFKTILNGIRVGDIDDNLLKKLNHRQGDMLPDKNIITLATTNSRVNQINSLNLNNLSGKEYSFSAKITGGIQKKDFPTEEILTLKKGAQIIFLKNDKDKRWVNGTLGKIEDLNEKEIKVKIDGSTHTIQPQTWEKIKYSYNNATNKIEEKVTSSFTQLPVRLAWALTIHKSQGQTFDKVAIDLGSGAFAKGQTYVALSRCRNLEGIYLSREVYKEDILVAPEVVEFMKKAKIISQSK